MSDLEKYLPFWDGLSPDDREFVRANCSERSFPKGLDIPSGAEACLGLLLVRSGRLRVWTMSDDGRELTLFRLSPPEFCLFSASCAIGGLEADIFISAEADTEALLIPSRVCKALAERSLVFSSFVNSLLARRFSQVMRVMDKTLNARLELRLAALLLEEAALTGSSKLKITHEQLGSHLGSPREVVTRMLRHFQDGGLVRLGRGSVELLDERRLRDLAGEM